MTSTPLVSAPVTNPGPERGPTPMPAPTRAALLFIFITVALDMLALGVMIPVLPKLIIELEHGKVSGELAGRAVLGVVFTAVRESAGAFLVGR